MSTFELMVTNDDNAEVLGIIKEEQISSTHSSGTMNEPIKPIKSSGPPSQVDKNSHCCTITQTDKKNQEDIDKLLQAKEDTLNAEFQKRFDREVACLMNRFDYILQNEQTRASYMLSEAHRERQEKIQALQTQLECKNLAGLMYVMCSERRKSKLEKMRLKEEYTGYVKALQDILCEGQSLILNLSRGYKTAARVDHEWRRKMKIVMQEFQSFVANFAGGTPEANQYFFDLPMLMKTETPTVDDPNENPCDEEEEEYEINDTKKTWWEKLDDADRPFVMFGDMAEFQPPQRRDVLKHVKAAKTAPKKWKQYVFNNMFVDSECSNANSIKDEYNKHLPIGGNWECHADQNMDNYHASRMSVETGRRLTTTSMDVRGNMGSILKMITSAGLTQQATKSTLLGARDSMEIVSTTKLRDKIKHSADQSKVRINVGSRRTSVYEHFPDEDFSEEDYNAAQNSKIQSKAGDDEPEESIFDFGSMPNDSLEVIQAHVPDPDHRINYEKVCPMDKCKRMRMKSFVGSLPNYMRANPFTHFEQTFEEYETCSPEQLAILKQRLEEKKKKERVEMDVPDEISLAEWTCVEGVGVQTSDILLLPPCTCTDLDEHDDESHHKIFNLADLFPVKQTLNQINKEFFFDHNVVFDRFKVIGQETTDNESKQSKGKFKGSEINEIKFILRQHPSLLEIFQANTQC